MSFQVDEDSALYAPAQEAARRWSLALGIPVTSTADGTIPIFLTDTPSCPPPTIPLQPGDRVGGCSMDLGTPDARIEIPSSILAGEWLTVLMHEMGHHLRGKEGQHVQEPGHLMSRGVNNGQDITPADVAFVCTPPSTSSDPDALDCHPPS